MTTNLSRHAITTGQETGHVSSKTSNQQSNALKRPSLLTVLQEAIALSTEQFTGPKKDRFSDILVSLKQSHQQLQPQTSAPLKTKTTSEIKAPTDEKDRVKQKPPTDEQDKNKQTENSPLLKTDKKKQETSQPVKSEVSKESTLTEKRPTEAVPSTQKELTQSSNHQTPGKQICAPAALYDSQIIGNEIGLNLFQQVINPLDGRPIVQDQNHPGEAVHQNPLKDQLTQWMNEGKVQIHKMDTPLEMTKPIVINAEEFNSLLNEEVKNQVLNLGDTKQQVPPQIHAPQNNVPQQVSQTIITSLQEAAPQKISPQANMTHNNAVSQEAAAQAGSPAQENTQNPRPSVKPQETVLRMDAPQDLSRTIPPTSAPQPVIRNADKGNQRTIDPKGMDKSPLLKINTLEEGSVGKTLNTQNRVSQALTDKVGGKMESLTKTMTMAEKVQALQQVKSQMKAALQKGETHMLVKLTPDDLGKIDIKLDISRDGTVSALFKTDNRETMILLSKYTDDLRQIFGEAGLSTDTSSMNFSSSDQQSSLFEQVAKSIGKNVPVGRENEAIIPPSGIINSIYSGLSGDRRLNITV